MTPRAGGDPAATHAARAWPIIIIIIFIIIISSSSSSGSSSSSSSSSYVIYIYIYMYYYPAATHAARAWPGESGRQDCAEGLKTLPEIGHVNAYPWKRVPLDFENREILST